MFEFMKDRTISKVTDADIQAALLVLSRASQNLIKPMSAAQANVEQQLNHASGKSYLDAGFPRCYFEITAGISNVIIFSFIQPVTIKRLSVMAVSANSQISLGFFTPATVPAEWGGLVVSAGEKPNGTVFYDLTNSAAGQIMQFEPLNGFQVQAGMNLYCWHHLAGARRYTFLIE